MGDLHLAQAGRRWAQGPSAQLLGAEAACPRLFEPRLVALWTNIRFTASSASTMPGRCRSRNASCCNLRPMKPTELCPYLYTESIVVGSSPLADVHDVPGLQLVMGGAPTASGKGPRARRRSPAAAAFTAPARP